MLENKSVDIILPNFNSAKEINHTLKSIYDQTFKRWNLFIIDDNSNKETKEILKRIDNEKIKIIWLKKNKGQGFCRNFAIRYYCKSEYIAFIDSDDIWKKNKLEEQLKFMEKNNYDFTYTYYEVVKFNGTKELIKKIKIPRKLGFDQFIKNTSIATSSMIIRNYLAKRSFFTKAKSCDDYYFKCSLLRKISFAYCLEKILLSYRIRSDSIQSSKLRNVYWVWKINRERNKLSLIKSLVSIIYISYNSLRKYGLR